jgi:hypothetical protein
MDFRVAYRGWALDIAAGYGRQKSEGLLRVLEVKMVKRAAISLEIRKSDLVGG